MEGVLDGDGEEKDCVEDADRRLFIRSGVQRNEYLAELPFASLPLQSTRPTRPCRVYHEVEFPHHVKLRFLKFRNYYASSLTIKTKIYRAGGETGEEKWVTLLRDYQLMENPHYENDAQRWHHINIFGMCDNRYNLDRIRYLRLVLSQPSSSWTSFSLQNIVFYGAEEISSRTKPSSSSHVRASWLEEALRSPEHESQSSSMNSSTNSISMAPDSPSSCQKNGSSGRSVSSNLRFHLQRLARLAADVTECTEYASTSPVIHDVLYKEDDFDLEITSLTVQSPEEALLMYGLDMSAFPASFTSPDPNQTCR